MAGQAVRIVALQIWWGERPREPILDCGDMPPLSKRGRVRALQIELSLKNPRQPR
jgi:hypothetical protein